MKMTHEEFQKQISEIPNEDLIIEANKQLSELCSTGGRSFRMTVPPKITDTDLVFMQLIVRFKSAIKTIKDCNENAN